MEANVSLHNELVRHGEWLFRRRSYLPLALITLVGVAFIRFDWPFNSFLIHQIWEFACLGLSFIGLLIRIVAIGYAPAGTSGRNTTHQIAAELNTTGIYSAVRHPLYLGNFLIGFGISLIQLVWWLPVIYVLAFWLYYERIVLTEEQFLGDTFGNQFEDWACSTPAFLPNFTHWKHPALPFSVLNVLRREHTALLVVVLGHTGVEFVERLIMDHRLVWEPFWVIFVTVGAMIYIGLRMLKKHTTVLNVAGR